MTAAQQASVTTLDKVDPGSSVTVEALQETNPQLYRKLHAMGVVVGHVLTVIRRAPLGDPITISTLGYTLALRLAEAQVVKVVPLG